MVEDPVHVVDRLPNELRFDPEWTLRLVFERFYRIGPSRTRTLGGSGIGLAIARALAEAIGGSVRAESDVPAKARRSSWPCLQAERRPPPS